MYDGIIVGAGPAGLAAAIACSQWGLHVLVIDEFPKPGGRLLGQLHQEPDGEWWNGIKETESLIAEAEKRPTEVNLGVSVYHIEKTTDHYTVHTSNGVCHSQALLIATGAAESAAPIPGWTLPGVMSIGSAQVMTNVHRVRVGDKGIVVGINVLSAAIARELQLAGVALHSLSLPGKNAVTRRHGDPKTVMDDLARVGHLAPSAFLRIGSQLAKAAWIRNLAVQFYPKGGFKMWGIPIHVRKAVTAIHGEDQVEAVTLCDLDRKGNTVPNSEKTVNVDFVCIAGGLYPLAELAAVAGCPFQYIEELGGHVPLHNEQMETPCEGVYVAGNITGIESAKVARAQGTVAGLSMARQLAEDTANIGHHLQEAQQEVKTTRQEASIQFHPHVARGRAKMAETFAKFDAGKGDINHG